MDESNDPLGLDALRNFIDGIEAKMDPDVGRITSRTEEREVKQEIAKRLGVEEEYHTNVFSAINEDLKNDTHDCRDAHDAVEERYDELLKKGKIREAPEYANGEGEGLFREVNREIEGRKTEEG